MKRRTLFALAVVLTAAGLTAAPRAGAVGPPMVTILDTVAVEGQSDAFFIVVNSGDNPVTVTWYTEDGAVPPRVNMSTPLPEAEHGEDYARRSNQQLVIPGNASQAIEVPVTAEPGDDDDDPLEFFHVTIETPVGVDRVTMTANATVVDDDTVAGVPSVEPPVIPDGFPQIRLDDASRAEGDLGQPVMRFRATLSEALPFPVSVLWRTQDGEAEGGEDFVTSDGTVTFAAGRTEAFVEVPLRGDTVREDAEDFRVKLNSLVWFPLFADDEATGLIGNDDPIPTLRISDVRAREGQRAVFRVVATNGTESPMSVAFTTRSGSARRGADFQGVSGRRAFDGQTDRLEMISVRVPNDDRDEDDERFVVKLADARGARIADATGAARIVDND